MGYKYTFFGEDNLYLASFLEKNFFKFIKLADLVTTNESVLLIISHNTFAENMQKNKKFFQSLKDNIFFLIPHNLKEINFFSNKKYFYYPLPILNLYKIINDLEGDKSIFFKDLILQSNNYLKNTLNNKKIYLTETELQILKALFLEKKIKKEKLKIDILNLKTTVDTKSLESHLSRIRKKIFSINSNTSIASLDAKYIFIS